MFVQCQIIGAKSVYYVFKFSGELSFLFFLSQMLLEMILIMINSILEQTQVPCLLCFLFQKESHVEGYPLKQINILKC